MKTAFAADVARLAVMLGDLRLPTIKAVWPSCAEKADTEGWPAARFLSAIVEHELAERDRRRIERHLAEARLPLGKTLDTFDFEAVPSVSKAQVMAIAEPPRDFRRLQLLRGWSRDEATSTLFP